MRCRAKRGVLSQCVWMSTQPGCTILPVASISFLPVPGTAPTAVILSPSTATSPAKRGAPEPSMIVPPPARGRVSTGRGPGPAHTLGSRSAVEPEPQPRRSGW